MPTYVALNTLYPEHHWEIKGHKQKGYWSQKENQRAFFEKLARSLGIVKPEDWYSISVDAVKAFGGSFIRRYYNSSLIKGKH
jgi:hypothetical protein